MSCWNHTHSPNSQTLHRAVSDVRSSPTCPDRPAHVSPLRSSDMARKSALATGSRAALCSQSRANLHRCDRQQWQMTGRPDVIGEQIRLSHLHVAFTAGLAAKLICPRSLADYPYLGVLAYVSKPLRYENLSRVFTTRSEREQPFLVKGAAPRSGLPGWQSQGNDLPDNSVDQQRAATARPRWSGHSCSLGPRSASPPAPNAVRFFRRR